MTKRHGKRTQLIIGGTDVSNWFNSLDVSTTRATSNATGFRPDGDQMGYVVGLKDNSISASGVFDSDPAKLAAQAEALIDADGGGKILAAPAGLIAGQKAFVVDAHTTDYSVSSPLEDVVSFSLEAVQRDGGVHGVALTGTSADPGEAQTIVASAVGPGATVDLGEAKPDGGVARFHLTDAPGDPGTLALQHSTDGTTWTAVGTVGATTLGAYEIVVASLNRYVRAATGADFASPGGFHAALVLN